MPSDDELARTATVPSEQIASPEPVTSIGRFRIEHVLGAGGMGVVYAAFDPDLERRIALKVIREGLSHEAGQRLLREARAMARLTHANVVTVHEVGSAGGRDYIAMELIEGAPLNDWLRETPRSEAEVLEAFLHAGRGLAAAHGKGLVHRDFKPHNVLRSKEGRIAVTDFGLAREAGHPSLSSVPPEPTSSEPDLTVPGSLLGTPAYMAPEQWSGGRMTPATDQFAYCVALWEGLTGARPFRGDTIEELKEHVDRGADKLDATKIPRRLRPILLRGLARDPAKRWPSMTALLARLAPRRRWRLLVAIAAVLAICAVIAIVVVRRGQAERDKGAAWEALMSQAATAADEDRLDAAIEHYRQADALGVDPPRTALELGQLLIVRGYPGDLELARALFAPWVESRMDFLWTDATTMWLQGNIAEARARLLKYHFVFRPRVQGYESRLSGTVMTPDGKPAAGATVAAGYLLMGDSLGIATPLWDAPNFAAAFVSTETDRSGGFSFTEAPEGGVVVAQLGELRSRPSPATTGQTLRLEPTTRIRGRVEVGGRAQQMFATAYAPASQGLAQVSTPVARDGTFSLSGIHAGPTIVGVGYSEGRSPINGFVVQRHLEVGAGPHDDLVFELPATRSLKVIVRGLTTSDRYPLLAVVIAAGTMPDGVGLAWVQGRPQLAVQTAKHFDHRPSDLDQFQPGDHVARFRNAPIGEATVCGIANPRQTGDLPIWHCQPLPSNVEVVVLERR